MGALRALVVDDHPMCRQAETYALLTALKGCSIIEAANLADAIGMAENANIILLDLGMPDGHGIAGLLQIISAAPKARVIVVTGNEALGLGELVRAAGGRGLVPKSAPMTVLVGAIIAVIGGECWFPEADLHDETISGSLMAVSSRMATLSFAERRVLGAMCDGSLNKQIAFRFGLSEITIKQHVKAVLRKLNVVNRTQAAILMQFHVQTAQLQAETSF